MDIQHPVRGLWCAMLTPLDRSGGVDHPRLVDHARRLLARGVDGLAPFGTTGEGQSFGVGERAAGLSALFAAGIPGAKLVAATGCAALSETITLTRHGVQSGCAACLVLPPFFFENVSDDGLFAWYARVIEAVGDNRLRVLLYHIPQVTRVPLSVELVARLAKAFPGIIAGVKDSSGDLANTQALLARVPQLAILVGHEPHLPQAIRAGGAGTICGVANTYPALVRALLSPNVTKADGERIATFIDISFRQPLLPAFKTIVAAQTGDASWYAMCPPHVPLDESQRRTLLAALAAAGLPAAPGAQDQ
ncbi:MAG TPA: dihydrodipicolinate synthase family protein [Casimicrobiaceae bacterium]|nr:dihydrodipicolinate synthase family protein [Casimicrobiaceae bacterium]